MKKKDSTKDLEKLFDEHPFQPIKSPLFKGYFWKDKEGNELSFKEFLSRWKEGMRAVTPLQQTKMQLWSLRIMIIGLLCGVVISIIGFKTLWWLMIILIGGLFNSIIQYLGVWQKKEALKQIDDTFNQVKGGLKRK